MLLDELQVENQWLADTAAVFSTGNHPTTKDSGISWAAMRVGKIAYRNHETAKLPLFTESSNSPAIIKHAMSVIGAAVKRLNPAQIPVITLDQPLYAIAKTIQWVFRDTHGEDKYVLRMGGLHVEKAALTLPGDLLSESGWVEALTEAGIFISGIAESCITAAHIKRTRYAHEVTAVVLYTMMMNQYTKYRSAVAQDDTPDDIDNWTTKMTAFNP